MSHRNVWEQIYRRFDPVEPAKDPAWRAPRPLSPVGRIIRKLDLPFADPRILLAGTVGTGKSTELLRLREERAGKELVLLLDLHQQFSSVMGDGDALQRVQAWEVVFQVGLAVLGAAREILTHDEIPPQHVLDLQHAWERVADATEMPRTTDLDLGKMASGMVAAGAVLLPLLSLSAPAAAAAAIGVGMTKAVADGVRSMLSVGRSKTTLPDQDEAMQTLLGAVNVLIGHVQHRHQRIVLIIDGLDRIRDEERALALFLKSELLGQLACRTIICAPFALRSAPVAAAIPRFETVVLANEPVLEKANPERRGPGVAFFVEMYRLRTQDLAGAAFAPDLLENVAYYSGGKAREFVKLVRSVAERAYAANVAGPTPAMVEEAIDEARRERERGLDVGQIGVLEKVMADSLRRLPEDPRARKLLDSGHLLPYPNESEWYYPHPLLTRHMLRTPGSTA